LKGRGGERPHFKKGGGSAPLTFKGGRENKKKENRTTYGGRSGAEEIKDVNVR